jgi:hypothetical protein
VLAFPTAKFNPDENKIIKANYDPFTQDFTVLPDVPITVKIFWEHLRNIAENDTSLTDTHPELYPSFKP